MAEFFRTLKFFFGDRLTWNDVLDWHNEILPLSRLPLGTLHCNTRSAVQVSLGYYVPQGGEAKTILQQSDSPQWTGTTAISRPAPFPFGTGGGIGQTETPINHANQGEVTQPREPLRPSRIGSFLFPPRLDRRI